MIKVLTNKKPVSKTSFFFHFLTLECLLSIQFALNRPLRATAREKNIAGVTHRASRLTELEPVFPGAQPPLFDLSNQKAAYLRKFVRAVVAGTIPDPTAIPGPAGTGI
jgi:hypothetical protein